MYVIWERTFLLFQVSRRIIIKKNRDIPERLSWEIGVSRQRRCLEADWSQGWPSQLGHPACPTTRLFCYAARRVHYAHLYSQYTTLCWRARIVHIEPELSYMYILPVYLMVGQSPRVGWQVLGSFAGGPFHLDRSAARSASQATFSHCLLLLSFFYIFTSSISLSITRLSRSPNSYSTSYSPYF